MNVNIHNYTPSVNLQFRLDKLKDRTPSSRIIEHLGIEALTGKIGYSDERILEVMPQIQELIGYWRVYPDKFIDALLPKISTFGLYFYQRVFLRASARHKYTYATFTRAFSKSFLAILLLLIRCILYPGAKLFIVSGTKEQAAAIAKEKFEEIIELIPAIRNEVNFRKSAFNRDYVRIIFKNGSILDVVAARNSARGGRRHGGLMEEIRNCLNTFLPLASGVLVIGLTGKAKPLMAC